jgi:inorganic pyrophosphatase
MGKKGNQSKSSLADPSQLAPFDKDDGEIVTVVIETPKGSRNKYAFDPDQKAFMLKKVLPAGMVFPYDFGFVPSTRADDGDPVDVLVLMDEPAFPGCILQCRLIGIIQGEGQDGKEVERNDRVIAVQIGTHSWDDIRHIDDVGKKFCKELEEFFVNYHDLTGKEYRILGLKGPGAAKRSIEKGMRTAKKG